MRNDNECQFTDSTKVRLSTSFLIESEPLQPCQVLSCGPDDIGTILSMDLVAGVEDTCRDGNVGICKLEDGSTAMFAVALCCALHHPFKPLRCHGGPCSIAGRFSPESIR